MVKDHAQLNRLSFQIAQRQKRGQPCEKLMQQLESKTLSSQAIYQKRKQALPVIEYPPQLPVSGQRDKLVALIRENQVVVLAGETGSG